MAVSHCFIQMINHALHKQLPSSRVRYTQPEPAPPIRAPVLTFSVPTFTWCAESLSECITVCECDCECERERERECEREHECVSLCVCECA